MNLKNVKRSALILAISATFIVPQIPHLAFAQQKPAGFPLDLFPEDDDTSDTGVKPANPTMPSTNQPKQNTGNNNNGNSGTTTRPNNNTSSTQTKPTGKVTMKPANVPDAYKCPIFDNRPHAELIAAIDALNKEVMASPECSGSPSAQTLQTNGNTIRDSISALQTIMAAQDGAQINTAQIDQSVTAALQAVGNIGDIINNNAFLNSQCGRQTMSTGKVLLALNDVINGLSPYALLAVSMNAALAPALPFVIGGVVATSGIAAISKMIDANTLKMDNPDHRKALLQNTCQFTKVARKVRFMQLAQSGKIETITQELEKDIDFYNTNFSNPTGELKSLLAYREAATKYSQAVEKQLSRDRQDLATIDSQVAQNNDDLMMCTLSNELVNWAKDGKTFPASAFLNLEAATAQGDRTQKLQALAMKTLHTQSMKRIAESAAKASEDDAALKTCAQAGRSWITGVRQSINMTSAVIGKGKVDLETELSKNMDYRQWKAQYTRIQTQQLTIKRVEKAMQELAKDDSVIDRSELAQRMVGLKAGLFGSRGSWNFFSTPPVLAWINHTKKMHDQAVSGFIAGVQAVRGGSFSMTPAGRGEATKYTMYQGMPYIDPVALEQANKISQALSNINLTTLPMGSRDNEIVCQQLESAWLDWSAAMDHLGAVQFFCDMIDPVLDVKMDASVVTACRGQAQLNGQVLRQSLVKDAATLLARKGYRNDAKLINDKLKELQCPMPSVSVMNQ